MNEETIRAAITYVQALFAGNADGHDAEHTLRVYRNTLLIAEKELEKDPGLSVRTAALAALLHDADDHKLFHTEDNANARAFLRAQQVDESTAGQIIAAVNAVSFSQNRGRKPATKEGKIVQDADRLDALGAVGAARTFAYGGRHGRTPDDSIIHFHEKLLLLKDGMNTEAGKALAERRHAFLLEFLREWDREMGE